jgi:hypothetical protein
MWLNLSRRYQIFWEVVGLERDPLSLVSAIEELLGRESSGSGLEIRKYGSRDPSLWTRDTLYPQKLALTSPGRGGRSVKFARGLRPRSYLLLIKINMFRTEGSNEHGYEPLGSIKCWKFLISCTTGGLSKWAQLHRVIMGECFLCFFFQRIVVLIHS